MFIVGFNGPPQSGKDTAAQFLASALDSRTDLPVKVVSVVDTLARMGAVLLGAEYSNEWYEWAKATPFDILKGATLRQWMIDQTEEFHKPKYGAAFWFTTLLTRHEDFPGVLIISNIGFEYEARMADAHAKSFLMIKMNRPGTDWDSRGPVTMRNHRNILNYGDLENLQNQMDVAAEILKDMWSL